MPKSETADQSAAITLKVLSANRAAKFNPVVESKYDKQTCVEYVQHLKGIGEPVKTVRGLAKSLLADGSDDPLIEAWLANKEQIEENTDERPLANRPQRSSTLENPLAGQQLSEQQQLKQLILANIAEVLKHRSAGVAHRWLPHTPAKLARHFSEQIECGIEFADLETNFSREFSSQEWQLIAELVVSELNLSFDLSAAGGKVFFNLNAEAPVNDEQH